jgi:hypothetical protein
MRPGCFSVIREQLSVLRIFGEKGFFGFAMGILVVEYGGIFEEGTGAIFDCKL